AVPQGGGSLLHPLRGARGDMGLGVEGAGGGLEAHPGGLRHLAERGSVRARSRRAHRRLLPPSRSRAPCRRGGARGPDIVVNMLAVRAVLGRDLGVSSREVTSAPEQREPRAEPASWNRSKENPCDAETSSSSRAAASP